MQVDKVSVLDHTIEYLRGLERKVEELESYKEAMERESTARSKSQDGIEMTSDNYGNDNPKKAATNKRKGSHKEKTGTETCKVRLRNPTTDNINISVSEKEAFIEIRCSWKENVLLQVIESLSKIHVEAQTIQSSANDDGTLSITVNAKVAYYLNSKFNAVLETSIAFYNCKITFSVQGGNVNYTNGYNMIFMQCKGLKSPSAALIKQALQKVMKNC